MEYLHGPVTAHSQGGAIAVAGVGHPLHQSDRLTTGAGGLTIVRLTDGTRMTLRPNSELVFTQYAFTATATDNRLVLRLLRGGLRAVTGQITRGSPNAANISTQTATIGIRGTDFDARLCAEDCLQEAAQAPGPGSPNLGTASARLVAAQGEVHARDDRGQRRRLVPGASVYPGDRVEASGGGYAALVFRDRTTLTLGAASAVRIDHYAYDATLPQEGRLVASILAGDVRVLAGELGLAQSRNVRFRTAMGTVHAGGAGLDIRCEGACDQPLAAGGADRLTVYAWSGSGEIAALGAFHPLVAGQGLVLAPGRLQPLVASLPVGGPRPDQVRPPGKLFSREDLPEPPHGLYVHVRDGHIELESAGEVLHLGRQETGFAHASGPMARPLSTPAFIVYDPTPHPALPSRRRTVTLLLVVLLLVVLVWAAAEAKPGRRSSEPPPDS